MGGQRLRGEVTKSWSKFKFDLNSHKSKPKSVNAIDKEFLPKGFIQLYAIPFFFKKEEILEKTLEDASKAFWGQEWTFLFQPCSVQVVRYIQLAFMQ